MTKPTYTEKLVNLLQDIIASSDANDGDSLANAINTARDYLFDEGLDRKSQQEIEET